MIVEYILKVKVTKEKAVLKYMEERGWEPDPESIYTVVTQACRCFLRRWQGAETYQRITPEVLFDYRGYHGDMNYILKSLLISKIVSPEEASGIDITFWKIKSRVLNSWNTGKWKNIRGFKIIGKSYLGF